MMGLDARTKFITGVVSIGGKLKSYPDMAMLLDGFFLDSCTDYAFILHDKDFLEDGRAKTPHIHFVCTLKKPTRLATYLNRISTVLDVLPTAITISKYSSFSSCIQYQVHKNNPEKYSYPSTDIHTNLTREDLESLISDDSVFDSDTLISMVASAPNRITLIRTLGLNRYRFYRSLINDIEESLKGVKR